MHEVVQCTVTLLRSLRLLASKRFNYAAQFLHNSYRNNIQLCLVMGCSPLSLVVSCQYITSKLRAAANPSIRCLRQGGKWHMLISHHGKECTG